MADNNEQSNIQNNEEKLPIQIGNTNNYMLSTSWILGSVIQLYTMEFCEHFVTGSKSLMSNNNYYLYDPTGRQYDQMTQSARSAVANIAEGLSRHETSRETEMKLVDVARASLQELKNDYLIYLLKNGQTTWKVEENTFQQIQYMKLERPHYVSKDWDYEAEQFVFNYKAKFAKWFDLNDSISCARLLYILCNRNIQMLSRFLEYLLADFKKNGGFSENLTKIRKQGIVEEAIQKETPTCPKCGAPMVEKLCKKGKNQGQNFWGCSNYPNCDGIINI